MGGLAGGSAGRAAAIQHLDLTNRDRDRSADDRQRPAALADPRLLPHLDVDAVAPVGRDARQPEEVDPDHAAGDRVLLEDLVAEQVDGVAEPGRYGGRLTRPHAA